MEMHEIKQIKQIKQFTKEIKEEATERWLAERQHKFNEGRRIGINGTVIIKRKRRQVYGQQRQGR